MTRLNSKTGIDIKNGKIVYTREKELIGSILEFLKLAGIKAWRNNTTGWYDVKTSKWRKFAFSEPGASDILGYLHDGKILAFEIKTVRDKASKEQIKFINDINSASGIGLFARSLSDVMNILIEKKYIEYEDGSIIL